MEKKKKDFGAIFARRWWSWSGKRVLKGESLKKKLHASK